MRKTALLVLILVSLSLTAHAANPFRRGGGAGGAFPRDGDIPDLKLNGKILTHTMNKIKEFYGANANMYLQYGIDGLMVAEYAYGARDRRMAIEMITMNSNTDAAGLFHYFRGNVVENGGRAVDIGAEGIVDTGRGGRNLYFYRSKFFVKIIYSGKEPVPDLAAVARFMDAKLPGGRDAKPLGIDYIKIQGVNAETIAITPGFCFNISFLPPAVWASAPGGGSVASDLFIITRNKDGEAADLFKDYLAYLKLTAEYFEEYRRGRQSYAKAVDPNQGRVVFTAYRNALIIAARPDGYEKGEALIDLVVAKMDEVTPSRKRR